MYLIYPLSGKLSSAFISLFSLCLSPVFIKYVHLCSSFLAHFVKVMFTEIWQLVSDTRIIMCAVTSRLWLLYNIWILIHFPLFWFKAEQKEKCLLKMGILFKKCTPQHSFSFFHSVMAGCFVSWQRTVGTSMPSRKLMGLIAPKKNCSQKQENPHQ